MPLSPLLFFGFVILNVKQKRRWHNSVSSKLKSKKMFFFLFSFKRHSQQANDTLCVCMYGEYEATATMKKALHLYEIDMQNET